MKKWFWPVIGAGLLTLFGYFSVPTVQALSPAPKVYWNQTQSGKETKYQKDEEKAQPTFEETKDFVLKYTRGEWQDEEGNRHTYALSFSGKRLKFTRRFTSKFISGFVEKIQVQLDDLDPTLVGKEETDAPVISLAATDGARKISVEVEMFGPTDGPSVRKYLSRNMAVPGSDASDSFEQDEMNKRLKKAWTHLVKLAGGKPSKKEPF